MVWVAISTASCSEIFFKPSKGAINGEIYAKEFIEKSLIPFLKEKHSDKCYIFWPDLANSHYSRQVFNVLENEIITFFLT